MAEYQHITHEFLPIYNEESEILILGTLPSVKSRESNFYYGHPQNRFWKLLAALFAEDVPVTIEEKKALLYRNHVAVWDVVASCDIIGSSDSSIKNVVPADIAGLLAKSNVKKVFCNGNLAKKLYDQYALPFTGVEAEKLPSTSPANAQYNLEKLIKNWNIICKSIENTEKSL